MRCVWLRPHGVKCVWNTWSWSVIRDSLQAQLTSPVAWWGYRESFEKNICVRSNYNQPTVDLSFLSLCGVDLACSCRLQCTLDHINTLILLRLWVFRRLRPAPCIVYITYQRCFHLTRLFSYYLHFLHCWQLHLNIFTHVFIWIYCHFIIL